MKTPAQALAEARARSAAAPPGEVGPEETGLHEDPRQVPLRRLTEWAVIEPDAAEVYSTRSWGAPITALKQMLVRLLRQYILQISSQQTRFNVYVVGELAALHERVRTLEEAAETPAATTQPPLPNEPSGHSESPLPTEPRGHSESPSPNEPSGHSESPLPTEPRGQ